MLPQLQRLHTLTVRIARMVEQQPYPVLVNRVVLILPQGGLALVVQLGLLILTGALRVLTQ